MFGVRCHTRAFSTSSCPFVYFTGLYSIEYSSTVLYFKLKMSESKDKNISDVPGTAKKHQLVYWTSVLFKILYCKIKKYFLNLFFMYYLCEKYYKPITVQYYIYNWLYQLGT